MKNLKNKDWWESAITRAIKTMAQTFIALVGTNTVYITDLDLVALASATALTGLLSIMTSLAGLPEVQ